MLRFWLLVLVHPFLIHLSKYLVPQALTPQTISTTPPHHHPPLLSLPHLSTSPPLKPTRPNPKKILDHEQRGSESSIVYVVIVLPIRILPIRLWVFTEYPCPPQQIRSHPNTPPPPSSNVRQLIYYSSIYLITFEMTTVPSSLAMV
jgi:hypothetical protein